LRSPSLPEQALLQLITLLVLTTYFVGSWSRSGQTVGMRAWGIRLMAAEGGLLPWERGVLRLILAVIGALALGAGLWWAYLDPQRRTWADRIAASRIDRQPRQDS
jgi:uncharacterized RDD family membrane protein YckC